MTRKSKNVFLVACIFLALPLSSSAERRQRDGDQPPSDKTQHERMMGCFSTYAYGSAHVLSGWDPDEYEEYLRHQLLICLYNVFGFI